MRSVPGIEILCRKVEATKMAPTFVSDQKLDTNDDTLDGTYVGSTANGLTMSTSEDRQYSFEVAKDVYVCCDGAPCTLEDLTPGSRIRVTMHPNGHDENLVTIVESLINQVDFADHH